MQQKKIPMRKCVGCNESKSKKGVFCLENTKQYRILEIFFRSLRGEDISVQKLANEYGVSTKSVSRSISDLKAFLADNRELVGNTEFEYSHKDKSYRLHMDEFLSSKELFALVEVMIGARAFSRDELLVLVDKIKRFTAGEDKTKLSDDHWSRGNGWGILGMTELVRYLPKDSKHYAEAVERFKAHCEQKNVNNLINNLYIDHLLK